jgi:hypothetical protein
MDDAMDPHGMDPHGMDPHGTEPPAFEHDGLEHGSLEHDDLAHPGLAHDGPEPGGDDPGYADHLDPDAASAQTTDLSFAEDYHGGEEYHAGDLHDVRGVEEPLFGADPDLHPLADAGLSEDQPFPPALDLDPPEPIDGYPWTDPAVLGHDLLPPVDPDSGGPDPADLFDYAGEQPPADGDPWSALLASPDPATSALARWWSGR